MNALVREVLTGEVISPDETVSVFGTTHVLNAVGGSRIARRVPAGLSIAEILDQVLDGRDPSRLVVRIGDHAIEPSNWRRVRVKPGAVVTFSPRPGNTTLLRTVLTVVVAIAAFAFAGPIAGSLTVAGFAITGTALAIATAVAATGIMLAGTLAINALLPIKPPAQPDSVNSTTLNSIQGAQNQANPFGPIPVVLGRSRQSPYYGAKAFTELVGDDQYLRVLFCLGYGPLLIEDLQIGETPLSSYTDVEVQILQGFGSDPTPNFPSQVEEMALSVDLNESRGLNIQTTPEDTDEISVDITCPQGVYRVNTGNGKIEDYSVYVDLLYRPTGTVSWTQFGPLIFGKSRNVQRAGRRVAVPRGQYDVAVQKKGFADDDNVKDDAVWTVLRSFKNDPVINFSKPLALVNLRIKATGQLNGIVNTFNCVTTSMVPAFDGAATWVPNTASQNCADLYRYVLQGAPNARARTDAQIDVDNLEQWWAVCVANGYKFNQVVNSTGSVYDKLFAIAVAGRAKPTFTNGRWGVDWDRSTDPIVQHFTPRNSWGFQLQRPYVQKPHGWRVSFINEDNNFTQDERIVYDDGYDASNATLFEGLEFEGVTDPGLIWKHGRFHIAQSRLRPEKIQLSVGWEHLVCTGGDRVLVTHDVALIGVGTGGRVKTVSGQVVTLDDAITMENGKTYGLVFRVADDVRSFERAIDMAAGEYPKDSAITLLGDLSLVKRGTLFAFGETEREAAAYRVQGIAHQDDLVATLTLVDDAPAISLADQGAIPAYNPNVTIPPDPLTLAPEDFRYVEATDGQGNSVRAITILSWVAARHGAIVASELQVAEGDNAFAPLAVLPWPQLSLTVPLQEPGIWSFRVRFQFENNAVSAWTELSHIDLEGLSAAPADVENIRAAAYVDSNTSIAWDEVIDYRPIRYAVRLGDSWESGLELGTVAHPPFAAHGKGTYWVKAYAGPDAQRAYSVNAAGVDIAGSSLVRNVIAERDEAADGWNGIFTGTVAKSGDLIRTGGSGDILSLTDYLNTPDVLNLGGQGEGTYEIDESRYISAGRVAPCRVTVTWKGSSQSIADNYLANPDILNNPDILAAGSTDLVQVYPEVSVAQNSVIDDIFSLDPVDNPANDLFAEADIFSADTSFGPWLKYEPGIYVGMHFRSRLVLKTSDPQVIALALEYDFQVDIPDRLDTWAIVSGVGTSLNQITVPHGGLAITFATNGSSTPEPFNGGPFTDPAPLIQITNTSSSAFDFEVTSLDLDGCIINPRLAGVLTDAPKTNISIQGW
jgi:hypothetical protein